MAKIFDKDVIFSKLKDEAEKKGFNMNPVRNEMAKNAPTIIELLEAIAIVINDILVKDNSKTAEIKAPEIKLNCGGQLKGIARKDDEITIDMTTDSQFMSFMEALVSTLQTNLATPHPPNAPSPVVAALFGALKPLLPTKVKGKITTASDKVKTS